MLNRRDWIRTAAGTGAAVALSPRLLLALQQGALIRKAIPATGEMLPVIGLGSSATFASVARSEELTALKEVFQAMRERGATLFDTAPSYGASEQVAGQIVNELNAADRFFWATKLNVAGRGSGGKADAAAAKAQVERSFELLKRPKIDLIQVHNLGDVATQLPILHDYKKQGRVRYVGVTTTSEGQYGELVQWMRNEPLDFIGIDYAADNREVEQTILPLAIERKIAVLAYAPFGRTSLFRRVGDRPVPEWGAEIDATTWAQVFLKFVVSHPAITAATPATSQAKHMLDNIGGGVGRLPDAAMRKRIADFVDQLPPAPARGR
ncbi:MAG: aldo/keto reductase [Gemmatimonadetes bacterium]|nr:aldo/keto reductase [Gemmatimonadota bacterium]MCC6771939.1 aldo/keto reductase [Gemmatimonadaceae bacterium]